MKGDGDFTKRLFSRQEQRMVSVFEIPSYGIPLIVLESFVVALKQQTAIKQLVLNFFNDCAAVRKAVQLLRQQLYNYYDSNC